MRNLKKKGFTLIELLAVIAIISMVMSAIYTVLGAGNQMYENDVKKDNIQTNLRLSSTVLTQSIKLSRMFTLDVNSVRFDSLILEPGDVKLAYIEGYDNKRFMYILRTNSTTMRKEFHRLNFSNLGRPMYTLATPIVEDIITADDERNYNNEPGNKVLYNGQVVDVPVEYTPRYLLYQNDGSECYLWVKKNSDGRQYRLRLNTVENNDFSIIKDEKISDYISNITLDQSGNLCKIYIKAKDRNKEKDLTTNVYLLNRRGDM